MRSERARPQQCWKSCANGSSIVALRFGDHGTKEMWGVVGWKVWPVSNFAQQHPTTCNRVCKRTQHVTSIVGSCWSTMLRPLHAVLRWCYTGRFATTIFRATQHHNIVATMLPMVPTLLRYVALKIVVANLLVSRVTSPLSSLTREARPRGVRAVMGRRKEGSLSPSYLPFRWAPVTVPWPQRDD